MNINVKGVLFDVLYEDRDAIAVAKPPHVLSQKSEGGEDSILEYLYSNCPNYKGLNPAQFLLILDGFEEMENPHHFKRALSRLLLDHPNIRICISMRSNFLLSSSDAFKDFAIYQLLPLSQKDIINTLKQQSIDVEDFLRTCNIKGLNNLGFKMGLAF